MRPGANGPLATPERTALDLSSAHAGGTGRDLFATERTVSGSQPKPSTIT